MYENYSKNGGDICTFIGADKIGYSDGGPFVSMNTAYWASQSTTTKKASLTEKSSQPNNIKGDD